MSDPVTLGQGYRGFQEYADNATDFLAHSYVIKAMISGIATATIVKVIAVTNTGADVAVGYVDVLPLVNLIDGANNSYPQPNLFNLPYLRIQGGANAIILDPQVGDLGIVVFASRDISNVVSNKTASPPGSRRMHSISDGMYIGGILNGVPNQFIEFSSTGIVITTPTQITVNAPTTTFNGNVVINGNVSTTNSAGTGNAVFAGSMAATGNVIAGSGTGDQVGLQTHTHGAGPSPNPGT